MAGRIPGSSGSGKGQVAGCCESGNEMLGPIQYSEFVDLLTAS